MMIKFKKIKVNENLMDIVLCFEGNDTNVQCNDTGACDVTTNIYCF
jgi:hypothetical protein